MEKDGVGRDELNFSAVKELEHDMENDGQRRAEPTFVAVKQELEDENDGQSVEGDENDNTCVSSLICLRCGGIFGDQSTLSEHVEECDFGAADVKSEEESAEINEPLIEISLVEDDLSALGATSVETEESIKYKCLICDQQYLYKRNLMRHMNAHKKLHRCPVCQKVYYYEHHLERHIALHNRSKEYVCHVCGAGFDEKDVLIKHLKGHENKDKYKCPSCDRTFVEKLFLNRHVKVHKSEDNFDCKICGKRFKQKCHINRHMNCHILEREYVTRSTPRSVPRPKKARKPDVNDATGGDIRVETHKRYICELCHKEYTQKAHLSRHKIQHANNPFGCELCDRIFKRQELLDEHMNMHYLGTQHICRLCNKKYPNKESLNRHVNTHTEDRLYPCKFSSCSRRFNDKSNLNKHMRIHTSDKRYECEHCNKNFLQKVHLNRHMINVHVLQKSLMRGTNKPAPGEIPMVYVRVDYDV